ncbi:MAG: ATP-binding protein, partial [Myxococcota bacterium]
VHDIIEPSFGKSINPRTKLRVAQAASLMLGSLAILVALRFQEVLSIQIRIFSFWRAIIPIPLIAAVFGLRASSRTFLLSAMAGVATSLVWKVVIPNGIGAFLPSVLINAVVFFTARMFDPKDVQVEQKPDGEVVVTPEPAPAVTLSKVHGLDRTWRYTLFSVYGLVNFMVPLFFLSAGEYSRQDAISFTLFIVACCLCYLPAFEEMLPGFVRRRMDALWPTILTFCLPFLTLFMLLHNQSHTLWMCNAFVTIFLLSVLATSWREYAILLAKGVAWAVCASFFLTPDAIRGAAMAQIPLWFWPGVVSMTAAGLVSVYYRKLVEKQRLEALQASFDQGVHDTITPATDMHTRANSLARRFPQLFEAYDKARRAGLDVPRFSALQRMALQRMAGDLRASAAAVLSMLELIRCNVRGKPKKLLLQVYSAEALVKQALAAYPFQADEEESWITLKVKRDFRTLVDALAMQIVLHNLINNAMHYARLRRGSRLVITVTVVNGKGVIRVWDNAKGMSRQVAQHVFTRHYSTREGGSGLGLSSCRDTLAAMGALIYLRTREGEFTEFTLEFKIYDERHPHERSPSLSFLRKVVTPAPEQGQESIDENSHGVDPRWSLPLAPNRGGDDKKSAQDDKANFVAYTREERMMAELRRRISLAQAGKDKQQKMEENYDL